MEIAGELVDFLTEFESSVQLRDKLGARKVVTRCSTCEENRTIELQILEESGDIEIAAFSDGPMGTVGVGAIFNPVGMRLLSPPQIFVQGVPTEEINVSTARSKSQIP